VSSRAAACCPVDCCCSCRALRHSPSVFSGQVLWGPQRRLQANQLPTAGRRGPKGPPRAFQSLPPHHPIARRGAVIAGCWRPSARSRRAIKPQQGRAAQREPTLDGSVTSLTLFPLPGVYGIFYPLPGSVSLPYRQQRLQQVLLTGQPSGQGRAALLTGMNASGGCERACVRVWAVGWWALSVGSNGGGGACPVWSTGLVKRPGNEACSLPSGTSRRGMTGAGEDREDREGGWGRRGRRGGWFGVGSFRCLPAPA
jgi:hypothetical protein